jgi:hypothetical protein
MDEKSFVVGADGHVLSEKELKEARQLDPPVSTGDAPDKRRATRRAIEIERMQAQIRKYEKRIAEYEAELTGIVDPDWRKATEDAMADARRKKAGLKFPISGR